MSVGYSQHWRLRRMDRWMRRSDPHLAAMLAIFARLTAGEAMPGIEQAGFRHARAWRNLIRMREAARLLLTYAGRVFRRIGEAVARPWPGCEGSWLGLGAGQVRSPAPGGAASRKPGLG
jgi:hypothetical protein